LANLDSCGFPLNAQKCTSRITGKHFAKKEKILADNTRERTQAEAQFKKTQKQKEGAEANRLSSSRFSVDLPATGAQSSPSCPQRTAATAAGNRRVDCCVR
jgi:hypothetical protein